MKQGPSPLRCPARAVLLLLFAVCSLQRVIPLFAVCNFCLLCLSCLQRGGVLFAACISFACSVHIFFTVSFLFAVCAGVLFAVCNSFACSDCSLHIFFYSFFFVCSVEEMIFSDVFFMFARNFFICSNFSLLK